MEVTSIKLKGKESKYYLSPKFLNLRKVTVNVDTFACNGIFPKVKELHIKTKTQLYPEIFIQFPNVENLSIKCADETVDLQYISKLEKTLRHLQIKSKSVVNTEGLNSLSQLETFRFSIQECARKEVPVEGCRYSLREVLSFTSRALRYVCIEGAAMVSIVVMVPKSCMDGKYCFNAESIGGKVRFQFY